MSPRARKRALVMGAALIIVPVSVYPLAGPWTWVWAPLLLMVLALGLLMSVVGTGEQARIPAETAKTVREELRSARVRATRVASLTEDYEFVFAADVRWRWTTEPDTRLRNPAKTVENAIVTAARVEAARYRACEVDVARHALAARLGETTSVHDGLLEVWADEVTLVLSEEDTDRLRRLADLRKEKNKWEVERSIERFKRAYFADDVFATPGDAIIWDLVRNGADVETTVGRVGSLAHLAEAGKGKNLIDLRERLRGWEPELASALEGIGTEDGTGLGSFPSETTVVGRWTNPVGVNGDAPVDFGENLMEMIASIEDDDQRTMTADRLVRVLTNSPLAHLAPRLHRRFDLPASTANDAGAEPGGSDQGPKEGPASDT